MIPTNHHHPQSRYDMEIVMYTQRPFVPLYSSLHIDNKRFNYL